MNSPYGARFERDERDRRALRDSRDPLHERSYRSEDHNDDRFAAGSRPSYNRDNEYRYDENRGRDSYGGARDTRSQDDVYGSGSSQFASRSYPRQQGSFERSGYDSDREFWEGQRRQYNQSGRFSVQPEERSMGGRYGGSSGRSGSYPSGRYGQQNYDEPFGHGQPKHQSNYWEHGSGVGGEYRSGIQDDQDYAGSSGNYWEHDRGGRDYLPGRRGQQHFRPDNPWQHRGDPSGGYGSEIGYGVGYSGASGSGHGDMTGRSMGGRLRNRPPKGYARSDERLREDICERLMHESSIDAGDVSVEVKEGKVTLDGTVTDRFMKHCIEDIAEECSGVKDVENRIRVARNGGETASQSGHSQYTDTQSTSERQSTSGSQAASGGHSTSSAQSSAHRSK